MIRRLITLLTMTVAFCATVIAGNVLSLTSAKGHPNEEVTVEIALDNSDAVAAVQLDIPLDASLKYVDGSALLEPGRSGGHSLSVATTAHGLRLLVYSGSMAVLKGNSGKLLTFKLKLGYKPVDDALHPKCILSDTKGAALDCQVKDGRVTAMVPAIKVLTTNINYGRQIIRGEYIQNVVLRNEGTEVVHIQSISPDEPQSDAFSIGDSEMEIPVGGELNIPITFMPKSIGKYTQHLTLVCDAMEDAEHSVELNAEAYAVNELSIGDVAGKSDETVTVKVAMKNMLPITAVQFDMTLPQGLQLVANSAVSAHNGFTAHAAMRENRLTVMLYSVQDKEIAEGDGDLLTFQLRITGEYGTYALIPEHIIMGSHNLENVYSGASGADLTVRSSKLQVKDSIYLGRIEVEQPFEWSCDIYNAGQENLVISEIRLQDKASTLLTDLPLTVAPGQTESVRMRTIPTSEGILSAPMDITSNDPASKVTTAMVKAEVFAPNSLTLLNKVNPAKNRVELKVMLDNYTPISALQADMKVTDALEVDADAIEPSDLLNGFTVTCKKVAESQYRLMAYSIQGKTIASSRKNGEVAADTLFTQYLPIKENGKLSGRIVTLTNIKLSDPNGKDVCHQPTAYCECHPIETVYDVNQDGVVDVTDMVIVNKYLLSSHYDARYDYDQDGSITILDVMRLLYVYLQKPLSQEDEADK